VREILTFYFGNEGLLVQHTESQAYYCGERKTPAQVFDASTAWRSREARGTHRIYEAPGLFTPAECAEAIDLAEAHTAEQGGWTTARHYSVPTTDIPIHEVPTWYL